MIKLSKKYLKSHIVELIIAPIFKILEVIFELMVPLIVANIIDIGINEGEGINYIVKQGLILIALAVIGFSSTMVCQVIASKLASNFRYEVTRDLYTHINSLSCKEIDEIGVSSLQTRINNDALACEKGMALGIRMIIRWPVLVVGCTIMAFLVSPSIGGIFILAGVLIGGLIFLVSRIVVKKNKIIQKDTDEITNITKENLSGSRVVRAFNKEDYEKDRFDRKAESMKETQTSLGFTQSFLGPLTTVITNLSILLIVYLGGFKVNIGDLTQGNITSLVSYMTQISLAVVVVGDLVLKLSKASVSAKRINEVFDLKSSIVSGGLVPSPKENVVEFKDVSFGYNSKYVLKNINFKVKRNEVVGIIGGTGSGKTTLIDLLMRFYDVNEGEVLVDEENIKNIDLKYLYKYVSLVSQKATLFKGTIRDNLLFRNKDASDEELYRALTLAQAKDVVDSKKDGLDSIVEEEGKNFSGGQRQRLSIARALVNSPKILILDDSSSALDYKTDLNLRKALKSLDDVTVFIISQRAASLKHADKILVLDEGELVATGTHDELLKSCDIYKEICDSQDEGGM